MFDQPQELLAINYFLEMNRANIRGAARISPMGHLYPAPSYFGPGGDKKPGMMVIGLPDSHSGIPPYSFQQKKMSLGMSRLL